MTLQHPLPPLGGVDPRPLPLSDGWGLERVVLWEAHKELDAELIDRVDH